MELIPGAKRSLTITVGMVAGLAALGLARDLDGVPGIVGTVARLWVFPHAGIRTRAALGKPATLMPWGVALAVAVGQWAVVAGLLARWTRDRSPWAQVGWTLLGLLIAGIGVLLGALILAGEIGMD